MTDARLLGGAEQTIKELLDRIEDLEARLELYATDGTRLPESCDGIACRDETIKLQDKRIEELEATVRRQETLILDHFDEWQKEKKNRIRLTAELHDGAVYLKECGNQFASIGDHVMQAGCYAVAERLQDTVATKQDALAAEGKDDG